MLSDHERQAEFTQTVTGQRHADNSTGVPNHERQRLGRGFLGGENQGSLVFSLRAVGQHHEFALGDGSEPGFDATDDRISVHVSCFGS